MFLNDTPSIKNAFALFNRFGAYSDLKLNLDKAEIIPIGMSQHSYESLPNDLNYIDINKKAFKSLGVWLCCAFQIS